MSDKTNNKKILLLSLTAIVILLLFSFRWNDSWEVKSNCFQSSSYSMSDFIELDNRAKWTKEDREGLPLFMWYVPSVKPIPNDEYLTNKGFVGYIVEDSSGNGSIPLEKNTRIQLTGELFFHRHSWIHQIFQPGGFNIVIPVIIDGKKYMTFEFVLTENLQNIVKSSTCYE